MSNLSVGIVGLPNVGKSTLFNALLKRQVALAANYPFATIEPNIGVVPVPDSRLEKLAQVVKTTVIKPATIEFVDIAGLVKGASQGEGLGNQFLAHIREVSVVCHVLRAFNDEQIIREGATNPVEDLSTVRLELQLADITTLEKQRQPKGSVSREDREWWGIVQDLLTGLQAGKSALQVMNQHTLTTEIEPYQLAVKELGLLTAKPELFVINVSETELKAELVGLTASFAGQLQEPAESILIMSNQIESELSSLSDEDQRLYLADLGLEASGLERLIQAAYQRLQLQSFLTAGEKEVRAWTIPVGTTAQKAAGVIHTDFEKLMISVKVANYKDFIELGGWKGLKEQGKMRTEGRGYLMQVDDLVEFMIGS